MRLPHALQCKHRSSAFHIDPPHRTCAKGSVCGSVQAQSGAHIYYIPLPCFCTFWSQECVRHTVDSVLIFLLSFSTIYSVNPPISKKQWHETVGSKEGSILREAGIAKQAKQHNPQTPCPLICMHRSMLTDARMGSRVRSCTRRVVLKRSCWVATHSDPFPALGLVILRLHATGLFHGTPRQLYNAV